MPIAFDVRALGSTVRIELDDSLSTADQESIKAHWVDLAHDGEGEPDHVIRGSVRDRSDSIDGAYVIRANSPEALAQKITSEVTTGAIRALRGEALMLHASAVALDDGRVIGFVGPSGRGKTTAAQVLGRAYGYVTDETLAVRDDRSVVAYPKPLSIGLWPEVKTTEPASTLGLRGAPTDDLRLAAIVLLDRRSGIKQPFVESVPIVEALSQLVPQASHLRDLERPLRTLLETIIATGGVRRVVYSEASSLPSLIDDLLQETDGDAPVLMDLPKMSQRDCGCFSGRGGTESDPSPVEQSDAYWRATYVDALLVDDSLIVLLPNHVVVLAGVGPTLWLAADGLTREELQEAALRELPEPPVDVDIVDVVSDALQGMVATSILART
jgi:energy-coupling factor transporter ATP-binding protein EcfA2